MIRDLADLERQLNEIYTREDHQSFDNLKQRKKGELFSLKENESQFLSVKGALLEIKKGKNVYELHFFGVRGKKNSTHWSSCIEEAIFRDHLTHFINKALHAMKTIIHFLKL